MKNYQKFIIAILTPLLIGYLGSIFTTPAIDSWYQTINKPSFNPPNWIFAPVWTGLFILMGWAFYLVWKKGYSAKTKNAFYIFFIQLLLNLLWSILFFGLKSPLVASIEIIVLWVFILLNIITFYKISKTSAYLLIPYLLWVSFASVLTFAVFWLNR